LATLIYSRKALADIEALTDFLAASDPAAADETADLLSEAISLLNKHPLIGRQSEQGLRELVISRGKTGYIALYRFRESDDVVMILSIRHQREAGYWQQHERCPEGRTRKTSDDV
jgi:plasmid stabilization system protein ParE